MAQWMIMLKLGSLITFIMHQIHSWCLHVSELHCTCDACSATVPQDQNTLFNYCICSIQLPSFSDCCLKLEEKARKSWPGASFQEQELYVEWTGSGRIRMVRYSSQFCQPIIKKKTWCIGRICHNHLVLNKYASCKFFQRLQPVFSQQVHRASDFKIICTKIMIW